jgi:hypothetical protein
MRLALPLRIFLLKIGALRDATFPYVKDAEVIAPNSVEAIYAEEREDWASVVRKVQDADNFRVDGWDDEPVDFSTDQAPRFPIEKLDERFRRAEGRGHGDPTL